MVGLATIDAGASGWRHQLWRLRWECRRSVFALARRLSVFAILLFALIAPCLALLGYWTYQQKIQKALQHQTAERSRVPAIALEAGRGGSRERLSAFYSHLPAYEDIPVVVESMLDLAAQQGLSLARGDYKPQLDIDGQFLRYQIAFPVAGDADAIQAFIVRALLQQETLALDSVHFKRERIEADVIDARIQWTLLTKLPASGAVLKVGQKPVVIHEDR